MRVQLAAFAVLAASLSSAAGAATRLVVSPQEPDVSHPLTVTVLGDASSAFRPHFFAVVDVAARRVLLNGHDGGVPTFPVENWTFQVEVPPLPAGDWTLVATLDGLPYATAPLRVAGPLTTVTIGSFEYFGTNHRLEVEWTDPRDGQRKMAPGLRLSDRSVLFWFFEPSIPEVLVKVLDGTAVNGHYWVFASSLTGVDFTLRIRMCVEGDPPFCTAPEEYHSPAGRNLDVVDLDAF
jgi:hypothetical protein